MVNMADDTLDFYMMCYIKREVYVHFIFEESMYTASDIFCNHSKILTYDVL